MLWQLRVLYVDISPVKVSLEWTQFLKLHSQLISPLKKLPTFIWRELMMWGNFSIKKLLNVISFYQTLYFFLFFVEAERRIFIYTDKDWIFIWHLWYKKLHQNRFFWNQWFWDHNFLRNSAKKIYFSLTKCVGLPIVVLHKLKYFLKPDAIFIVECYPLLIKDYFCSRLTRWPWTTL